MNKFLFFLIVCSTPLLSQFTGFQNSKKTYSSNELKNKVSTHKLIAILPFKVRIEDNKEFNRSTDEEIKQKEAELSKSLQSKLAIYLTAKKNNYTVNFLDIEKTNLLLKTNGMIDKLENYSKEEITKVLNVDAILSGELEQEKQTNGLVAITKVLVLKDENTNKGKTGFSKLSLNLNEGLNGELLWQFTKTMNENYLTNAEVLIRRMMKKVSRNFPYKK